MKTKIKIMITMKTKIMIMMKMKIKTVKLELVS